MLQLTNKGKRIVSLPDHTVMDYLTCYNTNPDITAPDNKKDNKPKVRSRHYQTLLNWIKELLRKSMNRGITLPLLL